MSARSARIRMPARIAMIQSLPPSARNPIEDSGRPSTRTTYSSIPATHAQTMSSKARRFARPESSWIHEPTGRLKNPRASSTPRAAMRQARRGAIAGISTDIAVASLLAARLTHDANEFIECRRGPFAIACAHELEEQAVEHRDQQRRHRGAALLGRQCRLHQLDPFPRVALEVARIALRILRRQDLQLVEQL